MRNLFLRTLRGLFGLAVVVVVATFRQLDLVDGVRFGAFTTGLGGSSVAQRTGVDCSAVVVKPLYRGDSGYPGAASSSSLADSIGIKGLASIFA